MKKRHFYRHENSIIIFSAMSLKTRSKIKSRDLDKFPKLTVTRPVWTGFKIAVRHKLLTHNNTRLYTAYKKGNSKYYCFIMK